MAVNEVQEVKLTTVRDEEQQVCLLHIHTQSTNHKLLIGTRASPIFYNVGLGLLDISLSSLFSRFTEGFQFFLDFKQKANNMA